MTRIRTVIPWLATVLAWGLVLLGLAWVLDLLWLAWPALHQFGFAFLFTSAWDPVRQQFGVLPQIYGTVVCAGLALGVALPIGVATAVLLSEDFLPKPLRIGLTVGVEVLAAIPSVVYGLWGIFVVIPWLHPGMRVLHQYLGWIPFLSTVPASRTVLATALVLAVMILPLLIALVREALQSVPQELRWAGAALGALPTEVILRVVIPAAGSGIAGAAVLALGRALGESMATAMLIGNANRIQVSLLAPGSTLASLIANRFGESQGLQLSALFAAALVLMGMTLAINAWATRLYTPALHPAGSGKGSGVIHLWGRVWDKIRVIGRRPLHRVLTLFMAVAGGLVFLSLGSLLVSCVTQGLGRFDIEALRGLPPAPLQPGGGYGNALIGSLVTLAIATGVSLPWGILTAVYRVELSPHSRLAGWVGQVTVLLSGMPSLLCGLLVYGVVVKATGHFSALAGGLALALVMLPLIIGSSEEAIKAVPMEWRWGSVALGATEAQTTWWMVLPSAFPGIVTGGVLAMARAIGETAPLLFTALFSQFGFKGMDQPVATVSVLIYNFALSPYPNYQSLAWSAALILLGFILLVSIAVRVWVRIPTR